MNKEELYEVAKKTYGSLPEHLWVKYPNYAVLRHAENKKWYAVIMNVPKNRLGLDGEEEIDIVDVKCEPDMIGSLVMTQGILPAYHMNKNHWITVLLDGSVSDEIVCNLLDISFGMTQNKNQKRSRDLGEF